MDQESDAPKKGLSVLRGGKKETPAETGELNELPKDKESKDKKGRVDIYQAQAKVSILIHSMSRHIWMKIPDLPEFPRKIHVMLDKTGRKILLEEVENGEVNFTYQDVVCDWVLKYIHDIKFPLGMGKLTPKDMKPIVTGFSAIVPPIPEPAMVLEKSQTGLTYRKLPFDFAASPDGSHGWPTFLEMMQRTTNALPLMHWIGSIFDPDADMQQYVWLHGAGQNGKSALGRFLSRVLGQGSISVQPPAITDRFWLINLVGKRLVIYGDCNNAKFVTSGTFKSMTGGDAMSAEIKNGATLQVVLKAKHLFFSNRKPGIDGGEADQRRIILCEMGGIDCEPDPLYEDRLWAEAPAFLHECRELYRADVGPRRRIKCDQTAARDLALENDEFFEAVFHENFIVRPGMSVAASKMVERLRNAGIKSNHDIHRFREFMEKYFGVRRERVAGLGFVYPGLVENVFANRV